MNTQTEKGENQMKTTTAAKRIANASDLKAVGKILQSLDITQGQGQAIISIWASFERGDENRAVRDIISILNMA